MLNPEKSRIEVLYSKKYLYNSTAKVLRTVLKWRHFGIKNVKPILRKEKEIIIPTPKEKEIIIPTPKVEDIRRIKKPIKKK